MIYFPVQFYALFIFLSGFSFIDTDDSQYSRGRKGTIFYSSRPRTLRHLFAFLHVRWLSRIFNRNACVYQIATRWDLPPYRITIWVLDWRCNVFLFTWWIDTRFDSDLTLETDGFELASTINPPSPFHWELSLVECWVSKICNIVWESGYPRVLSTKF